MSSTKDRNGPGRRAVVRWAWRLFRKEWRQQTLVLALVTLAVAAAVAGSAMTVNAASSEDGRFGGAGAIVHLDVDGAGAIPAGTAATTARFGTVEAVAHRTTKVPGTGVELDVRAQDPHGTYGHSLLALRSGRYPTRVGEVALTDGALDLLDARLGGRVTIDGQRLTVVGRVENPRKLDDEFALVPKTDHRGTTYLELFAHDEHGPDGGQGGQVTRGRPDQTGGGNGPKAGAPATQERFRFQVTVRGNQAAAVAAVVLVAMTLAMILVGLVATAGFVVVAQRRQRQLGLLAAIGATERNLRLVVVANGVLVGTVAALAGAAIGVLAWFAGAPVVEAAANHRIGRLDLPWGLVLAAMLLAVVMCSAAAWWPARGLARLPVIRALSGRPSSPRPVHRSILAAGALIAVAAVGLAWSRPVGHVRPLALMGSLVVLVLGVVFVTPAAVRALAAPAGRLPFAMRLALRDLARYQARAAASVAAITIGIGISVTIVVLAQAHVPSATQGNLSDRQVLINATEDASAPDPSLDAAALRQMDRQAAAIAKVLGHPTVLALDVPMAAAAVDDPSVRIPIELSRQVDPHSYTRADEAYVATPALLRYYGIGPSSVATTTDVLSPHRGALRLLDPSDRELGPTDGKVKVVRATTSTYDSAPSSLVTRSTIERYGWVTARSGWFIEASKPLTADQVTALRKAAAATGFTVETREGTDGLAALRNGATLGGGLLALAIVAMTIGLIRSEATRDLRTLTATGASARTRRAITATTAAALALLGAVLGTAGAYLAVLVSYHHDLHTLASPPIVSLLELLVGLPLVAAAAGWLLAGREPKVVSRQALD